MAENGWDQFGLGAHLLAEAGNAMDDKDVEIERLRALVAAAEAQEWKELQKARATIADLTAVLRAIDDGWEGGKLPMFLTEMVRAALARAKGGKE